MAEIIKKEGIILHSMDYKDNAVIVQVLCNDGIYDLILRGVKKINAKNKALNNVFSHLSFNMTSNKSLNTLTEGVVINSFYELYNDPIKLNVGLCILEKIKVLKESLSNYNILYSFTLKILNLLTKTSYPIGLLNIFELKLTYLLGIAPNFKECIICQKSNHLVFSCFDGGCVCQDCLRETKDVLTENETEMFKYLYLINVDLIDDNFLLNNKKYEILFSNILDSYYATYLDFYSKSKEILKRMLN